MLVKNFTGHLKTITTHKKEVRKNCFRAGLYWQGLTHDLSKYSPVEFFRGVKYYQGVESPNNAERRATGVSRAWLHHKGRNKHHMEYWIDYNLETNGTMSGLEMPLKYTLEMACDRIAASKVYKKEAYTDSSPIEYYNHGESHYLIHPNTAKLLREILQMLADEGEEKTFAYMRQLYKESKRRK